MTCDVCGRDNEGHLTFCQDCGRRLKAKETRVVAPTPPAGLPKADLPAPPTPAAKSIPPAARSRPEAPAFSFGPSSGDSKRPSVPDLEVELRTRPSIASDPPAAAAQGVTCGTCGTHNPVGYRYCVACGASVRTTSQSSQKPATLELGDRPASPPAERSDAGSIVGAPVVAIAAASAPEEPQLVTCPRCQGQSASGTRFCRFCGAPLADSAALSRPQADAALGKPKARSPSGERPIAPDALPELPKPPRSLADRVVEPARDPPRRAEARFPVTHKAAQRRGKLVIIVEDGSEGEAFPLTSAQIDIGREEGDILLRDDRYVSPRHARLLATDTGFLLRDLASTNGVYARLRKPHRLRDADLLLLGLEVLEFQAVNDGDRGLGHATQHGTYLFGSPAVTRHARLSQRTVEGIARDVYHLVREETVIGREMGDIVFTNDPFLSRRHAMIRHERSTNAFMLEDLHSSNGTYVAIRKDLSLTNGDFVRIGQHLFRVDLD